MSREALLVLGMHRSGTSAVSGFLARLGCRPPASLMPGDAENPAGYWESIAFADFHDRLLDVAGTEWDACTSIDCEAQRHLVSTFGDECRQILEAEFGDAPLFVLKDPRMSRLVPFWLTVLADARIAPKAVLVLRHPFEVARSLAVRDHFTFDASLAIWLRHVLDAEFETRSVARSFVRYEDLLADWRPVAARLSRDLQISWPDLTEAEAAEVGRFVTADLRHHVEAGTAAATAPAPSPLPEWVRRAWAALESLVRTEPDLQAQAELDAVRAGFDPTVTAVDDVASRARSLARAQVVRLSEQADEMRQRLLDVQRHEASLLADLKGSHSHAEALEMDLATARRQVEALETNLAGARHDVEALRQSGSWRITAPLRALYRMFK